MWVPLLRLKMTTKWKTQLFGGRPLLLWKGQESRSHFRGPLNKSHQCFFGENSSAPRPYPKKISAPQGTSPSPSCCRSRRERGSSPFWTEDLLPTSGKKQQRDVKETCSGSRRLCFICVSAYFTTSKVPFFCGKQGVAHLCGVLGSKHLDSRHLLRPTVWVSMFFAERRCRKWKTEKYVSYLAGFPRPQNT